MPGHLDDAGCAWPIEGDATISAIGSRGAQENHLKCEERIIASSFAGEAAGGGPEPPCHPSRSARQLVSRICACWFGEGDTLRLLERGVKGPPGFVADASGAPLLISRARYTM